MSGDRNSGNVKQCPFIKRKHYMQCAIKETQKGKWSGKKKVQLKKEREVDEKKKKSKYSGRQGSADSHDIFMFLLMFKDTLPHKLERV